MQKKVKRIKGLKRRKKAGLMGSSHAAWLDGERLVASDSLRGTVLKRLAPAVHRLVDVSPDQELLNALSTKTGMDALIHLVSGDAVANEVAAAVDDPLREARARAAKKMTELLSAEGGPIGVEAVAKLLGIGRAAIDKRRKTGALIGIEDRRREILYPSWQFTSTGLLPGIDDALKAMIVVDPWMRMQFFLSRDNDLGERPLDALRQGRANEVLAAANRFGRLGDDG